jgi:ABC-2 type transport system ATP-binding protein
MCARESALSVASMQNIVIEVHDLHKSYDDQPVLRGVSFAVGAGEIFGIAGRNGAGKTTTVEILQGLRSRDGGHVEVLGLDPARERKRLRPLLGAQLQTSALPDRIRVREALRLFARLAGDTVDWRALAESWRLSPLLPKPYGSLSGGQRQRLFLALAMVNRPRLVFLDELTQGLDPVARREAWQLIERARDQGTTVVLVTHDMEEAERLCDRVALIDSGHVVALDTPAGLAARASGGKQVRFLPSGHFDDGLLTALPEVTAIHRDGHHVVVTGTGELANAVIIALYTVGVTALDVQLDASTLEDAFVRLTGKHLHEDGEQS